MAKKPKKPADGTTKVPRPKSSRPNNPNLYTLEVFIIDGPLEEKFIKKNPVISRTIQIRGDQTLADLHEAIFDAYDRFDEHMYEFQFGKRTMDGPRYVLSLAAENGDDYPSAGLVDETTIDSLGLKKGRAFAYWFDFGDDWWHQINVESIEQNAPPGKFPKITKRVGKSPPQYPYADK
jgi:Plasmid pRiA4b ORF-3-like protein